MLTYYRERVEERGATARKTFKNLVSFPVSGFGFNEKVYFLCNPFYFKF